MLENVMCAIVYEKIVRCRVNFTISFSRNTVYAPNIKSRAESIDSVESEPVTGRRSFVLVNLLL